MDSLAERLGRFTAQRRVLVLMGVAGLARLPGLASKPLWYDEAFAVLFSAAGPKAMAYGTLTAQAGVAADVHPLGYYSLLWLWTGVFGEAVWTVRLLSALMGLATVYVGMRFAGALFGNRAATVAGILLAIGPFPVHYAQEVRMYALMALLLISASWAYFRAIRSGRLAAWAAFALLSVLAQYTHTLSAFFLVALAATAIWQRANHGLRNTIIAGLAAMLLYAPWLVYVPSQLSRVRWAYWVTRPGAAELLRTWLVFVAGLPVSQGVLVAGLFGTVLATVLAGLGSVQAYRTGDRTAKWGFWCLYLAAAPPALMFAFSFWQPVYLERALLASGLMYLLWLAWGITRPELGNLYRWTAGLAALLAMSAGLAGTYTYRGFPYAPFAELAESLRSGASEERIVHSNKITALPIAYYDRSVATTYLADPPGSASDTLAPATQQVLAMLATPTIDQAAANASKVALVVFDRERQDYQALGYQQHPALEWLERNFRLSGTERFGELQVYHYRR